MRIELKRWILVAIVAALVVSAVVLTAASMIQGRRDREEIVLPSRNKSIAEASPQLAERYAANADESVDSFVETMGVAARRAVERSGTGYDAKPLAQVLSDTLRVYTSGSMDDWGRYLADYGIEPPPMMMDEGGSESLHTLWNLAQRVLRSARFDPEGVRVGEPGAARVGSGATQTARRDAGRPFLRDLRRDDRSTVEVVMPGAFQGLSGDVFEASLGIEFTFDPDAQRWILTGIRFYDVPTGTPIPGIPL